VWLHTIQTRFKLAYTDILRRQLRNTIVIFFLELGFLDLKERYARNLFQLIIDFP